MKSRQAFFNPSNQEFEIRESDLGDLPSENHVKINVKWVGICGSDLHSIEAPYAMELSLGHEWVGEVVETGSQVKDFSPGDYVTSTVKIECGQCKACLEGVGECSNQFSLAVKHGMMRELAYLPQKSLVKLPMPATQNSTLFEILAVAENVFNRVSKDIKKEDKILILGAGLLGISVGLVFKREGYSVLNLEILPSRIERARKVGLDCIHLGKALLNEALKDHFPMVIDATGDHLQSEGGAKYLEHFGKKNFNAIILAKYQKLLSLKTDRLFSKEANIKWIQGCTHESLEASIRNWAPKIEELGKELITHTFDLKNVKEAFETAREREKSSRVILKI